jgi:hypothetical protein
MGAVSRGDFAYLNDNHTNFDLKLSSKYLRDSFGFKSFLRYLLEKKKMMKVSSERKEKLKKTL